MFGKRSCYAKKRAAVQSEPIYDFSMSVTRYSKLQFLVSFPGFEFGRHSPVTCHLNIRKISENLLDLPY
jgi:hypothetical protein